MTTFDINGFTVKKIENEWSGLLQSNLEKVELIAEKFWSFWKKSDVEGDFDYFYAGCCWENVFTPLFLLNEKYNGKYKLLVAKNTRDFHIVIIDEEKMEIFDPTYEKNNTSVLCNDNLGVTWNSACKGLECTIPFLKRLGNYEIISQEEYFSSYNFQIDSQPNLDNQLKEKREDFFKVFGKRK